MPWTSGNGSAASDLNPSAVSPVRFGKFWLTEKIAFGGMAEIFRALAQTAEGKRETVAIKRILPQYSGDEEFVSMLVDEAKLMVFLNHPNIVPMMEFGRVEDSYYIAMEYVEGTTLKGLFKRVAEAGDRFSVDLAVHLVREVGAGLAYAHRKADERGAPLGIVHRDISPANILLSFDGDVKIADFGISKAANQSHRTQIGVIRGKTGYMSPEQTRSGGVIDQRSDIYSLGIILFELLAGQRLYKADSIPEALRLVRKSEIPSIAGLRPEVPRALEAIARKALTADPGERYQTAQQMVDELNEFLTRWVPSGRPPRVTHADLVGFLRRYFRREMEAREREITSAYIEAGATEVDRGAAAQTASETVVHTGASRPVTIAANPLYELSEKEFELPSSLSDLPSGAAGTFGEEAPRTASLKEALSASVRIAGRFSPLMIAGAVAGAAAIGAFALMWRAGARRAAAPPPAAATPGAPSPKAEVRPAGPKVTTVRVLPEPKRVKLFLDGALVADKPPYELPGMAVGREHAIRVAAAGYRTQERRFTVEEGALLRFVLAAEPAATPKPSPPPKVPLPGRLGPELPLKPGALSASASPWADIYVDGRQINSGGEPVIRKVLPAGTHRIRFVNPELGACREVTVRIVPGKETKLTNVELGKQRSNCR